MSLTPRQEEKLQEILDILQEECAEVIQAVSKIRRFGRDNSHKDYPTQRENFTQEIGDVLLLIDLLISYNVFSAYELQEAKLRKASKLKVWSNIYKEA